MKKLVIYTALLVLIVLGGLWGAKQLFAWKPPQHIVKEDSTIILEKILEVRKLVTVEGYFSEIYTKEDYMYKELPLLKSFLRKSIGAKVEAKVAVGYDLKKIDFTIKPEERIIIIDSIPDPEILYTEPKLTYYDLTEGYLNGINPEDLTEFNEEAIAKIKTVAEDAFETQESELQTKALEQVQDFINLVRIIAEESGFKVVFNMRTIDSPSEDKVPLSN